MKLDFSRSTCKGFAWASLAAALLLTCAIGCGRDGGARAAEPDVSAAPERTSIVAMARLEPKGRVVRVNAATDDIIREVLVSDGADVELGQVLMKLDGFELRSAEREEPGNEPEAAADAVPDLFQGVDGRAPVGECQGILARNTW